MAGPVWRLLLNPLLWVSVLALVPLKVLLELLLTGQTVPTTTACRRCAGSGHRDVERRAQRDHGLSEMHAVGLRYRLDSATGRG
jgi:hypothetical protein